MIFRVLLISLILGINLKSYSQITISKSIVEYSLNIHQDSVYRILSFWKDKDSTIYSSVKYSISDFNQNPTEKILEKEISTINQLWDIALDSLEINLHSFNMGYPLLYSDVLKIHIQAFIDSKEWQNHVKQNGKNLDYKIIKQVMLEYDVYTSLNDFLKTKGYFISGFETEKHGFVTKENLQKVGFDGNEIIPMPFIVWVILGKIII